jgi:pimeloyl-ACP methyl ester carboxylesterase
MATTGNPDLPSADAEVQKLLLGPAPLASDIERIVSRDVALRQMLGGPDYPTDNATLREWSLRDSLRAYYPAGTLRQMAAGLAAGDRREALARISVPTVVLHGTADIFVPVAAGKDTAQAIPGAELRIVEGMGHELAIGLVGKISEAVIAAAERATGPRPESAVNAYGVSQSEGGFLSGLFQRFRRARVPAGA